MSSYNRLILMGNLTRDPESKFLQSGTCVTEFGLAVNEKVKRDDQWIDEPMFVDVTLFGRTAEVAAEYLKKGSATLVEGRLKYETWEKDGQKRSKHKMVGDRMQLVGSKRDQGDAPSAPPPAARQPLPEGVSPQQRASAGVGRADPTLPPTEDEIPF